MIMTNSRNARFSAIAFAAVLMNVAVEGQTGASAAPEVKAAEPKLTRAEKQAKQVAVLTKRIAEDTAKLAELQLEIQTGDRLSGVVEGTAVVARIGRGETSKEVGARIKGIKDDENGARRYKIEHGVGFDADTVVIQGSQIVRVLTEAEAAGVSEPVAALNEYGQPVDADGNVVA